MSSIGSSCQNWPGARQRNPGPWRRCHKEAGVSRLSERWSARLPESMTLPKGEKHHFIIQCDSHPLSLSNMPYVPVTGRLAGLSTVTGLFTHCSQSDTISCRKNHQHSAVTGCQVQGTNLTGPWLGGEGKGQRLQWATQCRHPHSYCWHFLCYVSHTHTHTQTKSCLHAALSDHSSDSCWLIKLCCLT